MDKGFCEKCNSLVEYDKKEFDDTIKIKGKIYNFKRLSGFCKKCGEEISSNEINDENINRIDRAYYEEEIVAKPQRDFGNVILTAEEAAGYSITMERLIEIEISKIKKYLLTDYDHVLSRFELENVDRDARRIYKMMQLGVEELEIKLKNGGKEIISVSKEEQKYIIDNYHIAIIGENYEGTNDR